MERRFVIYEDDETGYNSCHIRAITETELLHRLSLCMYSKDRIATLLNDTEKEQPEPIILSRAEPVPAEPKPDYKQLLDADRRAKIINRVVEDAREPTKCTCERCTGIAVESLYKEQPAQTEETWHDFPDRMCRESKDNYNKETEPKPTREEWEAFADQGANEIWPPMIFEGTDGDIKRASVRRWVLTMPGVTKEKP